MGFNPRDLEFKEGRVWLRNVIANAFGVPEDLLTTNNSNKGSSTVAIDNYYRFTIAPKLKRIEDRLNSHLMPLYDDDFFLQFDNPIPDDKALLVKQEEQDLIQGVLTVNEVRAKRGLVAVEWGNSPYSPRRELIRDQSGQQGEGRTRGDISGDAEDIANE